MKINVQDIGRLKDLILKKYSYTLELNTDIPMPMPTVENYEDVAYYFVFEFCDNDELAQDFLDIITKEKVKLEDINANQFMEYACDFFSHMPKRFLMLIERLTQEKYLQFQKVMTLQAKESINTIIEQAQMNIGEYLEQSAKKV